MTKKEPISKRIYLDYAATTPVDPEVFHAMKPFLDGDSKFGNPNSLHSFGQEALKIIDASRASIAKSIGAEFNEIIFTGSATEANNLALRGAVRHAQFLFEKSSRRHSELGFFLKNRDVESAGCLRSQELKNNRFSKKETVRGYLNKKLKIIISAIEHESVFETAKDLERDGIEIAIIPVDKNGFIDVKKLERELDERTILVSVMYANNEIGTIQPITKISELIRNFRNSKFQNTNNKQISNYKNQKRNDLEFQDLDLFENCLPAGRHGKLKIGNYKTIYPLFHVDAVQAFQFLDCNVKKLGIDLMTLSAHKIYGPKGVGILYIKNPQHTTDNKQQKIFTPIMTGGGQEFGLRSGTQNVAGIVGFARAIELVSHSRARLRNGQELENKRIIGLKKELWETIQKIFSTAEVNGSLENTLPNILNVYFPGVSSELLLIKLDMEGVAVSSGSACHARSQEPSRVIQNIYGEERARESIRFSLGKYTTEGEIKYVGEVIKRVLENIK